jgi:hypothetical protein
MVIAKFGIPRQVIMDRDVRQTGRFRKEISNGMSLKQSLANGQAKVLNQTFEIFLHACIGLSRENWALQLNSSAFSWNSMPHSAMSSTAAYLLHGYTPVTKSTILHCPESMPSLSEPPLISRLRCSSLIENIMDNVSLLPKARTIVKPLLTKQPKVLKLRLFFLK